MKTEIFLRDQLICYGHRESHSWETQDRKIAALDPLQLDSQIHIIPLLNKAEDVKGLIHMLYSNLPFPDKIQRFNFYESLACMRDIGIFLGSIKRHGVEPVAAIPELDYILDELHSHTDLPPRDTLFHYTIWNPKDHRVRTYTGLNDEIALIKSVQQSMYPLVQAIYDLIGLHCLSPEDSRFIALCESAEMGLSGMVDGIVYAKRLVSPEIFAKVLRFYYDPITLYNKEYIGPGAVEMPLFVFDHLLWSSDCFDNEYIKFKTTYLPFNLPAIREVYKDFDNKPSLVTKIIVSLAEDGTFCSDKVNAAKSLLALCNRLKSFRMPHKKLAEESYAHQNEHKHNRDHGSGGYSTDILGYILSLNLKSIAALENAIKEYMKRHNKA